MNVSTPTIDAATIGDRLSDGLDVAGELVEEGVELIADGVDALARDALAADAGRTARRLTVVAVILALIALVVVARRRSSRADDERDDDRSVPGPGSGMAT